MNWIFWNCAIEASRVGGAHLVTGATGEGSKGSMVSGSTQRRLIWFIDSFLTFPVYARGSYAGSILYGTKLQRTNQFGL